MKQTRKRLGSLLLALCTVLTLLPAVTPTARAAAPVTGDMDVGGTTVSDLSQDAEGTGWSWTAGTATLTLTGSYAGQGISIRCEYADTVNLSYAGDVTVRAAETCAPVIYCVGSLVVTGTGGTLTLIYTGGSYGGPLACGELRIIGGSLNVQSNGGTTGTYPDTAVIYGQQGVVISGDADVTATATGTDANGIGAMMGDITISTSGAVTANGTGTGYAIRDILSQGRALNITSGTVTLGNSDTPANLYNGTLNHTGGTLNGSVAASTVIITGKAISQIQTAIQSAINAASSGDTVTVEGTVSEAAEGISLQLRGEIPVVWQASITAAAAFGSGGSLISLSTNVSTGDSFVVKGSIAVPDGSAMAIYATGAGTDITVSDGGTVSAASGTAISANGANAVITVSGGTVFAYGSTAATGSSSVSAAICMNSGSPAVSGTGMVIAWNQAAETTSYTAFEADNISILPETGATAHWLNSSEGVGGISYSCTANSTTNEGFISIAGVTVSKATPASPTSWPTAAAITYGAALSSSALTGGSGDGAFAWTDGATIPTVNNSGYSVTFTPTDTNNYETVTQSVGITVNKADVTAIETSKSVQYQTTSTQTVDIAALVSEYALSGETVTYTATDAATGSNPGIIQTKSVNASGSLSFTVSGSVGDTATIPITVSGFDNYNDITVNVIVTLVEKTPVTVTGVSVASKIYDGVAAAYTGSPTNTQGYSGSYEYAWATSGGTALAAAPKDAGSYTLTVNIPDSDANYMGEQVILFTISPKALTVKPQDVSIYNGAALPASFTLAYVGLVSGDTLTPTGTPTYALQTSAGAALTSSAANGSYVIKWTNPDSVTFSDAGNYTITKADGALTISSQPTYGGGGSSTPTVTEPTVSGGTATTTVTPKVTNGAATASVTSAQVTSALEAAKAAAAKSGEKSEVEISLSGASGASKATASIPKSSVTSLVTGGIDALIVSGPVATVSFDAAALSTINSAATGDVSITAAKVAASTLPEAAQSLVGDRPVYDFTVTSGGSAISSFGGTVTVSIPYTPASGEDTDGLVVYYISDSGSVERVENARYDTEAGAMVFTTTHFSSYAVGYLDALFSDVLPGAWYYDAVNFIAETGVTTGTGDGKFSPDTALTRGQFLTMLLRAYGIAADENATDNFSDAGDTYYTGYLSAAKRLGISNGVGENQFAPEQAITRQEMFTLLYNALKAIDALPEGDSGKALSDFTDSDRVASYAQEAMTALVKSGVVSGSDARLNPAATTTRAQMAQVLYKLLGS